MVDTVRQAGGIPFRTSGGRALLLLVSARSAPGRWIFPKGHVEPGESAGAAALREVEEESGAQGELLDYVGRLEFPSDEGPVEADYFLVRFSGEPVSREGRMLRVLPYEEARRLLTHDDARRLLDRAWPRIEQYARAAES